MIYTNNTFEGYYPVGTAAIVRADNKVEAARLLENVLMQQGLQQSVSPDSMNIFVGLATILCDGNY